MISISDFAQRVNHPLCEYMARIPLAKGNPAKQKIHFLSGDPTAYGNLEFRMPEQGYDIMRGSIANVQNHGYTITSGAMPAREAIKRLYKPRNPISVDNIVIQHGVNQGLLVALQSFTNPGDEILVPEVGYPLFQKLGPALGVNVIHYRLRSQQDYEIDLQHLAQVLTPKCQFLFLINPSNPMGTIFSKQHMLQILHFCDLNQLPIVSDEVYHGESFAGVEYHSFGDLTEDVPVLALCGVQKLLSVPGWCTSWTVIFDKNHYLADIWRNILTCGMIYLHSNKFTQLALPELIDKVGQFSYVPIQKTKPIHDRLLQAINDMKGYQARRAQGTFYMVVVLDLSTFEGIKTDEEYVLRLIQEQNVAFLPLSIFGGSEHGFRLITCAEPKVYDDLLQRLAQFNSRHQIL